jgi:hypothetical protein
MPMTIERRSIFRSCSVGYCILTGMALADGGGIDNFQQHRHGIEIGPVRYIWKLNIWIIVIME